MTAVSISTADTAAIERRAKTAADIATVTAARTADARLDERQLVTRCRVVVGSFNGLDADTAADVTSDLLAYVGERFGWTPRRSEVAGEWLTRWAVSILRRRYTDERLVSMDADTAADAPADSGDERQRGTLAEAEARAGADYVTAAPDPDAADIAQALALTAAEADAVTAALSGWGSAIAAADAWQCSHAAARKRLQRGRDALRKRYPHARDLADAIAAAVADLPDATTGRVTLPLDVQPANADGTARTHGSPTDVLRFIDRTAARVAIWQAGTDGRTPPNGSATAPAAALPDAWRGHDLPCRTVEHRQHVPALPQRSAATPPQRAPQPASGPTPHRTAAADVLRYLHRMEALADTAAAWAASTPSSTAAEHRRGMTWGQLAPLAWGHARTD